MSQTNLYFDESNTQLRKRRNSGLSIERIYISFPFISFFLVQLRLSHVQLDVAERNTISANAIALNVEECRYVVARASRGGEGG